VNVRNKLCFQSLMLTLLAAFALAAGPAFALTAVDEDSLGQSDLGYVSQGATLEYQHTFDPFFDDDVVISAIDSAWLYVSVVDDSRCASLRGCAGDWFFESEVAAIDLQAVHWSTGQATARIFWGDVTAEADLLNNDGVLEVSVHSAVGDFVVLSSTLVTRYTYELAGSIGPSSGSSPMPEPSAALLFALGALVVRGPLRRRRTG
jgi:hypothetical protein